MFSQILHSWWTHRHQHQPPRIKIDLFKFCGIFILFCHLAKKVTFLLSDIFTKVHHHVTKLGSGDMTVSVLENVCLRFKNTSRWISVKNIIFKAHIVKDSEGLLDVYGHKLLVNLGNSAAIIVHEFKTIPIIAFFALKTLAECDILVLRFHKNWQTVRSSL